MVGETYTITHRGDPEGTPPLYATIVEWPSGRCSCFLSSNGVKIERPSLCRETPNAVFEALLETFPRSQYIIRKQN